MYLKRVKLTNFRHHKNTDLAFGDGIIAFIGPNGSGKSTIFEAISYALYGSQALRTKLKESVTFGSSFDNFSVELVFANQGQDYTVFRSYSDAFIKKRSLFLAKGTTDVTLYCEKLLSMDLEQFRSAFFTEQKKLEFLSGFKTRGERENFILEILGYKIVDDFLNFVREKRKETKIILQSIQENDADITESQINLLVRTLSDLRNREQHAIEKLEKIRSDVSETKNFFEALKEKKIRHDTLQAALSASLKAIAEIEQLMTVTQTDVSDDEISDIEAKLDSMRTKHQTELTLVQSDLKNLSEQIAIKISIIEEKMKDIQLFDSLLERINFDNIRCPTCGQPLNNPEQARSHLTAKRITLEKEVFNISSEIEALKKNKTSLMEKQSKIEQLEQEIRHLERTLEKKKNERLVFFEKKKRFEDLCTRKAKIEDQINNVRREIEELNFSNDMLKSVEVKLSSLIAQENQVLIELSSLKTEIKEKNERLELLEAELRRIKDLKQRKSSLAYDLEYREIADKVLTDFRLFISSKIRPHLSELASKYLAKLTNGKITAIQLEKNFEFSALSGDDQLTLLSGGEEDIVSIALRLSLSEMIVARNGATFELLILDEVFGHLDFERRVELLHLLKQLKEFFRQIFVISHIEYVQEFADSVFFFDYDKITGIVSVKEL
ncbi:MAG: SMC family ATPase [Deltaproteobacteria bacterium]|nr:SMC family ATPase [Deltaproteobacteria bacterium]